MSLVRFCALSSLLAVVAGASSALRQERLLPNGDCLVNNGAKACLSQGAIVAENARGEVTYSSPKQRGRGSRFYAEMKGGSLVIFQKSGFFGRGDPIEVFSIGSGAADYAWLSPTGVLELYEEGMLYDGKVWSSAEGGGVSSREDDLIDPATGVSMPVTDTFSALSSHPMRCLGLGVRAKAIAMVHVNVYSVGMYVDEAGAVKKLRSFAGKTLSKDKIFYEAMAAPGAWSRALKLTFVRTVAAEKVVEALTRLDGVDEIALDSLSSILLGAIGSNISSGDSIVLGWDGANRLTVSVRGKDVGQVTNADLPTALYQLYLGDDPVAPMAKESFGVGAAQMLSKGAKKSDGVAQQTL